MVLQQWAAGRAATVDSSALQAQLARLEAAAARAAGQGGEQQRRALRHLARAAHLCPGDATIRAELAAQAARTDPKRSGGVLSGAPKVGGGVHGDGKRALVIALLCVAACNNG
jgi:hypothetical protein